MGRAPCCEKVGLKRGRWTAEEDQILANYIQENGEGSWRSLPKNAGLLRCGKSCRLRWINYLRADLKRGNITSEEEETIVKLHSAFGNRWSLIAGQLPGRTDNEIKNYWNSHLSRRIYRFSKSITTHHSSVTNSVKFDGEITRKRGRTSRSSMKKQKLALMQSQVKMLPKIAKDNEEVVALESRSEDEPNYDHGEAENEVLGPDEWLDSEIERLSTILQREGQCKDPDFKRKESYGTKLISQEIDANGVIQGANNEDSANLSSNAECSGSATNTSGFNEEHVFSDNGETLLVSEGRNLDEEYVDWEFSGFGDHHHDQCEPWDDGDLSKMLCWLWDEGKKSHQ